MLHGFLGFVIDGEQKIVRVEHGFTPTVLGLGMLRMLTDWAPLLSAEARKLRMLDVGAPRSPEDAECLGRLRDEMAARPAEAAAAVLRAKVAPDGWVLASQSRELLWGYMLDLDHGWFEVYEGWQTAAHRDGRFINRVRLRNGGYPPRLVAQVDIPGEYDRDGLPTEEQFLAAVRAGARVLDVDAPQALPH